MKPNVARRNLASETLGMSFRLWISMKARRCIMKAGSLDNYLLTTKPDIIGSRMGIHLRNLIIRKKKDPLFKIPYIPGSATASRTRKTKGWEYRAMPSVYMPANVRIAEDHSKYYIKTP
jgi:ribosomal protein L28